MAYPRRLADNESAILHKLLQDDLFAGAAAYRSQLPHVTVTGTCACGRATIDLRVDRGALVERGPIGSPLPVEGRSPNRRDPHIPFELLIFVKEGFLTSSSSARPLTPEPRFPLERTRSPRRGALAGRLG